MTFLGKLYTPEKESEPAYNSAGALKVVYIAKDSELSVFKSSLSNLSVTYSVPWEARLVLKGVEPILLLEDTT